MAALDVPQIPASPKVVDENGNVTQEWLVFFNQLVNRGEDHEERLEALEP